MKVNSIGLPVEATAEIVQDLNVLLSGFQVYYQNLRGLHWNIRGKRFFNLHVKFEELYNEAQLNIDNIAERILALGGKPFHTFEDYLKLNQVSVAKDISKDEKAVQIVIESIATLLQIERKILNRSADIGDEGTNSMMSDLIKEQEKTVWMMKAWLEETV